MGNRRFSHSCAIVSSDFFVRCDILIRFVLTIPFDVIDIHDVTDITPHPVPPRAPYAFTILSILSLLLVLSLLSISMSLRYIMGIQKNNK